MNYIKRYNFVVMATSLMRFNVSYAYSLGKLHDTVLLVKPQNEIYASVLGQIMYYPNVFIPCLDLYQCFYSWNLRLK